jgi:hypothetical protein
MDFREVNCENRTAQDRIQWLFVVLAVLKIFEFYCERGRIWDSSVV